MQCSQKHVIFLISILSLTGSSFAQSPEGEKADKKKSYYHRIDASYIIGAQVFNDNFVYNPGASITSSFGHYINKNVGVGLGVGYKQFESETFLPIYCEISGHKTNKSNTPIINMQLGYSIGWSTRTTGTESYDFNGGIFISAGVGRKIKLKKNYSVLLHWSYQHQFASMDYAIFNTQSYREVLNYDMIVISLGFIRER